ncbi:Transposon TX1 uncharacterized protein [Glycine soja]
MILHEIMVVFPPSIALGRSLVIPTSLKRRKRKDDIIKDGGKSETGARAATLAHLVPQSPVTHLPPPESSVKETLVRSDDRITKDLNVNAEEFEEERDVEVEDAETLESIDNRPVSPKAEIKPMDPPKLWVDAVSDNRNPSKGLSMEYVAPNMVNGEVEIEIEEDDIATEMKFWETTLILYALGEDLSMNAVKSYMVKMWNFVKLPEMYYHDNGYFILRFNSHDDMDAVLMKGPFTIRNVPLLLKEWKPDFNLQKDMLRTLPLWVKLPKLPLHLWGVKSLNKIGSAIGVPLVTDECTASKIRVSYARILVEVDITKTLVKEVTIKDCEGRKISQGVEYEWRPLYYEKCHKLGHQCKKNDIQKEKQWKPKTKPLDEAVVANVTAPPDVHTSHEVINETGVTNAVVTPKEDQLKINEEYKGDIWTRVSKPTRDREHRRVIWKDLEHLHSTIQGPWCVIGDFNNVASANDRIGGRMVTENEYIDLKEMMNVAGLSEMESIGDYFTWSNKHNVGTIYSRINRVLGNVKWFQDRLDYHLKILPPSVSDHALLCVEGKMQPKNKTRRFKFYNCMVNMIGYEEVVHNSWNRPIRGTPMHVLWQKLQRLKLELVQLGKSMTNARHELVKARRDLDLAQNAITHNRMDDNLIDTVKKCTERVINWNEMEGNMLRQRAKVDWLRMGDENNAFFHSIIKAKHQNRSMSILQKGDGTILTEQSDIHNEVMEFYRKLMGSTASNLRHIDIQAMRDGKQITFDQGTFLTATVTEAEIVKALQGIGDLKAPGIDGYGAKFFKNSWHIVKKDFIAAVNEFFEKGTLLKVFNSTLVTLIPKSITAKTVKDYRPIAGCSTFYKVISKILTRRLGSVIQDIVHTSQVAFVLGQVIHNHILLATELMKGYTRKGGTPRCMMQIDLQKAYDMVDWGALEGVLTEFGLPKKFIGWVMKVITTVNYRFNINGELSNVLEAKRGIRQGDPISPLLFVLMMEYLNRIMVKMQKDPNFNHHSQCERLGITHMSFADDVLLLCRGDERSIEMILKAFSFFSKSTGLQINPAKCKVFCGGLNYDNIQVVKNITGFEEGTLPVRYLGVPLSCKKTQCPSLPASCGEDSGENQTLVF